MNGVFSSTDLLSLTVTIAWLTMVKWDTEMLGHWSCRFVFSSNWLLWALEKRLCVVVLKARKMRSCVRNLKAGVLCKSLSWLSGIHCIHILFDVPRYMWSVNRDLAKVTSELSTTKSSHWTLHGLTELKSMSWVVGTVVRQFSGFLGTSWVYCERLIPLLNYRLRTLDCERHTCNMDLWAGKRKTWIYEQWYGDGGVWSRSINACCYLEAAWPL